MDENEIYAAIGEDGFSKVAASFYRQVAADDILGPMYPASDLAGAEKRLRDFLLFRFGGSMRYVEERGHPRLRMRHAPFFIDLKARDRWFELMRNAMREASLPEDATKVLESFFDSTSTFLINRTQNLERRPDHRMHAHRVVILLFTLAAGCATGQFVLGKEDAAKVSRALEGDLGGEKLDCQTERIKPFLDFAFRFEAGFVVRCPVKIFEGKAVHLVIYTRITPTSGEPVVLGEERYTPEMPADMRPHTNIRKVNSEFELSGGYALGEGEYTVDLLVVSSTERFLQSRWKVKTVRGRGEEKVPLAMQPNTVGQVASRPWDGTLVEKGQGVRVTVLLDAAPRDPNSTKLRVWDRTFLLDSVSSLLKQMPCESVRLVAFNLDQQREIFREDKFDRTGFRRLGRALRELELGTVEYSVLKRQRGSSQLLASLTNQEIQADSPSDVVIFLGPVTRMMQKIHPGELAPIKSGSPRFFDFEYFPVWMNGGEFPDAVHNITTARNGTVLKIHSPGELARGIQRMLDQLSSDKVRSGS